MRDRIKTIIEINTILLISLFSSCTRSTNLVEFYSNHYNIEDLNRVIFEYFPESNIEDYELVITNKDSSRFSIKTRTVLLARKHLPRADRTIAHETCHLILASITNNANIKEINRYWDEGFCNIFAFQTINEYQSYREKSLNISYEYLMENNISIEKVQNWSEYYDRDDKRNFNAYNIGSTFVFFLFEKYGVEETIMLIKMTRDTGDIIKSIESIEKIDKYEIEQEWIQYIKQNHV